MNIYKAEKSISDKIRANNTVLCFSQADPKVSDIVRKGFSLEKLGPEFATANLDDSDLYLHQSILVTTTWNKNDEVFLPEQVWTARHTPTHKPTNFEHNSTRIVGHIVDNYAVDSEINLIDEASTVDELPDKFHILTSSVIYRIWHSDEEYERQVAKLIEDIELGEMFVSMECKFRDFSYALQNPDGGLSIVNRNPDTAFLSSHLRSYGGTGLYKNIKIGRVLKDITFIGKGYTKKPANEDSVVFSPSSLFSFNNLQFAENFEEIEKDGVLLDSKQNTNGDLLMSEAVNNESVKLVKENSELKAELAQLKQDLAKANDRNLEQKINDATEDNKVLAAKLESATEDLESARKELETAKSATEELTKQFEEAQTAKAELEKQISDLQAEQALATRKAQLVEAGYTSEEADRKATIFASLNEDMFGEVLAEMTKKKADEKEKNDKKAKFDEKAKADVDPDSLKVDEDDEALAEDEDGDEDDTSTASYEDDGFQLSEVALSFSSYLNEKLNKKR